MIDKLHIELTTYCNAACPVCARNEVGAFPLIHLSINKLENISQNILNKFKKIHVCGSYGDPILHPNFFEFLDYFIQNTTAIIEISTNGNPRKPEWWKTLGEKLGNRGHVIFGLDGLEDTHAVYRKNTDFNKIIENVIGFMSGGGHAWWQFIPFKHNEHQIIAAKKLSQKLGFKHFFLKDERHPELFESWSKPRISFDEEQSLDTIASRCLFSNGTVYMQADGNFLPCCYIGNYTEKIWKYENLTEKTVELIENSLKNSWKSTETAHPSCIRWCINRKINA